MSLVACARRGGVIAALAGLGIPGLAAVPATAPAATVPSAASGRAAAVASAAGSAGAARGLPADARFVTAPRTVTRPHGVRQACSTPVRPGQMMCMALVAPRGQAAGPDTSPPSGAYNPADLQEAYGLASASATPSHTGPRSACRSASSTAPPGKT